MASLAHRPWVPDDCEALVQSLARATAARGPAGNRTELARLVAWNAQIHDTECLNLNPAANVMNPKAEALLAAGLGSRPSLGYPGGKYEMGLEAIEAIEVIAAELAAEVFGARHAEIRVGSGALANLYVFMATARPGDRIIAPPAAIGGHVTHHAAGAAGLYGLEIHEAPVAPGRFTVDLDRLQADARRLRPRLITIGGSLNLEPHPVAELRAIADEVGATLLYDAAHLSGLIAGKAWQQPLAEGAHVMTMSTYKSLAGPPGGLILTDDADLAQKLDAIAFPGLTANFDAGRCAALAMTLVDWQTHGRAYAAMMRDTATALAAALAARGVPVFATKAGFTTSHQLAIEAAPFGGGQAMARLLRRANLLASGIGLPLPPVEGDMNGLRLGTNELTRRGMTPAHMPALATFIARVLVAGAPPEAVAPTVTAFRQPFTGVHFAST
jgi:glycine hydroxymethyltransferase